MTLLLLFYHQIKTAIFIHGLNFDNAVLNLLVQKALLMIVMFGRSGSFIEVHYIAFLRMTECLAGIEFNKALTNFGEGFEFKIFVVSVVGLD